ncbi:MAG: hypothetical protein HC866_25555 [Leptolyngbyaceae cyanobacterium RU_5_1]|nr:hypothetical protein [Leptolyngbyaceae cyanobacterium RU_5_1]
MIKLLVLFAFAANLAACRHTLMAPASIPITPAKPVSSNSRVSLKAVTLIAREERFPPVGESPKRDRDIGFASIFLRLENDTQADATVVIQRIELRGLPDNAVQMVTSVSQTIHLKPLEYAVHAVHLSNKRGYSKQNLVQAVVTYQSNGQVRAIASTPVEITRS